MNLAPIDIIFAALVLILTIRCALRGFIEEFMSVAAFVLGLLCAVVFVRPGAELVRGWLGPNSFPEVLAFVGLFLIAFILVKLLEKILGDIVDRVNLEGLDRALGVLLGLLEGCLVVAIALFVLSVQPLFDPSSLLAHSWFAKYLLPIVHAASDAATKATGA